MSKTTCIFIRITILYVFPNRYGQLSGMVEPIAGLLGIFAVSAIKPLLPYALAFAAGAMIYVVVNDIIPESNSRYARVRRPHGPSHVTFITAVHSLSSAQRLTVQQLLPRRMSFVLKKNTTTFKYDLIKH